MCTRLTRSHVRVELTSFAYFWLGVVQIIILRCVYASDVLPYTRGPRIPHLLGVSNYLNNYVDMYKRLTRSRIPVELASPAYLG